MNSYLLFLLKSTLCLSILYLAFSILMRHETYFRLNRMVLILIVLSSAIIPFLTSPQVIQPFKKVKLEPISQSKTIVEVPVQSNDFQAAIQLSAPASKTIRPVTIPIKNILAFIYLTGVLVSILMLLYSIVSVLMLFRKSVKSELNGFHLMVVDNDIPAFSFGRNILIYKHDYDLYSEAIITHEQSHIRLGHFYDLMLMEIMKIIFWFNPLVYSMIRDLKAIHEFQADDYTLHTGIDATNYQLLIIQKCVGHQKFALANSFNHCQIKNRITMMNKQKTSKAGLWKVATFLPLLALLLITCGRTDDNAPSKIISPKTIVQENKKDKPLLFIDFRRDGNYINDKLYSREELIKKVNAWMRIKGNGNLNIMGPNFELTNERNIELTAISNATGIPFGINKNIDQQAVFPGGVEGMFTWIEQNIRYPIQQMGFLGRRDVDVKFEMNSTGKVVNAKIIKGLNSELDAEALRIVSQMPSWKPALKNGMPVCFDYKVSITFKHK